MKRSRDPLAVSPHWHVDCRIEEELPEDNVVGTRFLINAVFAVVALAMVLYTGRLGYEFMSLRRQVRDWDFRINERRTEVSEIRRMQQDYAAEAAKIEQAYSLVRPRLYVSGFFADIARNRPDQVMIDVIEWTDANIAVRGSLAERGELATRLVNGFVEKMRRDTKIAPLFRDIKLMALDRGRAGERDTLRFEIIFRLKDARP
jgi:hypothetical protein